MFFVSDRLVRQFFLGCLHHGNTGGQVLDSRLFDGSREKDCRKLPTHPWHFVRNFDVFLLLRWTLEVSWDLSDWFAMLSSSAIWDLAPWRRPSDICDGPSQKSKQKNMYLGLSQNDGEHKHKSISKVTLPMYFLGPVSSTCPWTLQSKTGDLAGFVQPVVRGEPMETNPRCKQRSFTYCNAEWILLKGEGTSTKL